MKLAQTLPQSEGCWLCLHGLCFVQLTTNECNYYLNEIVTSRTQIYGLLPDYEHVAHSSSIPIETNTKQPVYCSTTTSRHKTTHPHTHRKVILFCALIALQTCMVLLC